MNIGAASKASHISAKMIRYYEQIGLISPAYRTNAGYRSYTQSEINRLHFIRHARDLGFSVTEIGNLLNLWDDQTRQSADVKNLAKQHIKALEQRMQNMQQMIETLKTLINSCAGDHRPDCPILNALQSPNKGSPDDKKRTGAVIRPAGMSSKK